MSELVRIVRSGITGLDLALGSGFRFVRRIPRGDQESATLLIRGGPGTGKSVLAQSIALQLAAKLGGDVLYVCIEVLPSEVIAQRMGFNAFNPAAVVDLSQPRPRDSSVEGPNLVLGMRDMQPDGDGVPDLGSAMLDLARIAAQNGYRPKVVVIDSLSDGYNLGSRVPRATVDGICKLAIEQGWALVLLEEAIGLPASPWSFAVDTVLSLVVQARAESGHAERQLFVLKHRFGPCEPGPHRLQIDRVRVRVIPPMTAYRNAARDLELPQPAKGRSLLFPVLELPEHPERFRVPDDAGCIVLFSGPSEDGDFLERTALRVGALTTEPGRGYRVLLRERGVHKIGTLHQFVDGDDWLEMVVDQFSRWDGPNIIAVIIGPTDALTSYEQETDLHRAITVLSRILAEKSHVAVIYGSHPVLLAGVAQFVWHVGLIGTELGVRVTRPDWGIVLRPKP